MVLKTLEYKTKAMLWGGDFINGIRRDLVAALILLYFILLGHDVLAVTMMFAVSRLLLMLFEFPAGTFADNYSRKKSVIISFSLMAIAFLGIFIFKNFWYLSIFYIMHDVAWAFQSGKATAWAVDNLGYGTNKNKLTSLFARLHMFERMGAVVGGLIGLIIVSINFRFIWLFIAVLNLFWAINISFMTKEENFHPEKNNHHFIKKIFLQIKKSYSHIMQKKNKQIKGLISSGFVLCVAFDAFMITIPLIFFQIFGISTEKIPVLFSIMAFFALFSTFMAEKTAHRWGYRKPLFFGFLGMGLAMIVFAISKSIILSVVSLTFMHFLEIAFAGVVFNSKFQLVIPSKLRATLGSTMSVVWSLASAVGFALAGIGIKLIGLSNTAVASGLVAIIAGAICLVSLED
ncbi:MAG: MFS transporter [archaeon]